MGNTFPRISIAACRVNAELNQREFADKMGVSLATVVNWESGKTEIKYKDLVKLSELYEMPIEYLRVPEGDE